MKKLIFLSLLLFIITFTISSSISGQNVEILSGNKKGSVRIGFTGHTYPLVLGDLQYVLADNMNKAGLDYIVLGGDVVTGTGFTHLKHKRTDQSINDEQWDKFELLRKRLKGEVFYIPGNHDFYTKGYVQKYIDPPHFYYAKKLNSFLLIFLNTIDETGPKKKYDLDEKQLHWLKNLLSDYEKNSTVLIFMHHKLWALQEIQARQPVGNINQFKNHLIPLLHKFKSVYLFAGDGGIRTTRQEEKNINFFSMSNRRDYIGFFSLDLNSFTQEVKISKTIIHDQKK
jgi:hypothetical protein